MSLTALLWKELKSIKGSKVIATYASSLGVLALFFLLIYFGQVTLFTGLTRELAIQQFMKDPKIFGISVDEVEKLKDNINELLALSILVTQLPMIIPLFTAIMTYTSIWESFNVEKACKTMEVLLASPVKVRDIVLAKYISGIFHGVNVWLINVALAFAMIQYLSLRILGRLWAPSEFFITLTFIIAPSMICLASVLALLVGIRGSETLAKVFDKVIVLIPLAVMIIALPANLHPKQLIEIYEYIALASVTSSLIIVLWSRRMINRLSFIVNY